MNILFTVNDGFVPQLATSICSICENNNDDVKFYLMAYNIKEENQLKLKKLVNSYGNTIEIIPIENLHQYIDFDYDTLTWDEVILARLLVDKLLPEELDRIIYLDADIIVMDDLSELWNLDLKGKTLGMSIEPTVNKDIINNLNLGNYPYHNSGVIIIDLNKWREIKAEKRILTYFKYNNDTLFAPDQDAINGSLKEEIFHLPPKYNFTNIYYHYTYKFLKKLMGDVKYFSKEVYDESMNNPVIIHFIGEEKPWRIGSTHKYRDDYVKYNSLTEWSGEGFEDWGKFFVCWKIFNKLTKPFPSLRYFVINNFQQIYRKIMYKK